MPNAPLRQAENELRMPLPRAVLDGLTAAGHDLVAMASEVGLQASALGGGVTAAEADRFRCAAWAKVNNPAVRPMIEPDLVARIHLYLSKVLEDGEPLLKSCAGALAISERTLQR